MEGLFPPDIFWRYNPLSQGRAMIGQTISHYRITEKLGEGGMGVVYKANDTRLDRPVALKFLAPHLLRDDEGQKRFRREARAAAKLDHPNICTVHEIDEVDDRTFIVMAFLEGRPLSERIKEGPLKLNEALSIAIQMAEGLEAAHEKGITHRDLKPDNVMLMSGSRGLVKLMDFGLAQLSGSSKFTREGTTLGTVNYMSPEQGEGAETDPRTDIWALGVVLYEMVAGQRPFRGDFDQAIVFSIMNEAPEPLTGVRTGVPKELERIVNKCLAKKAAERYQVTADLLVDLQQVRRAIESDKPGTVSVLGTAKPHSRWWFVVPSLIVMAGMIWWLVGTSRLDPPPRFQLRQITRDAGLTGEPAISKDGKMIAYASDRAGEGNADIWVQQVAGGEPIQLTFHEADDKQPHFSPDGSQVVFRSDRDGGGIYVVPALGGSPRLLAERGLRPRYAPDGQWVAFFTRPQRGSYIVQQLHVVPSGGGPSRQLASDFERASYPVWSPDGGHILFLGLREFSQSQSASVSVDWWLVPLEGGVPEATGVIEALRETGLRGGFVPSFWSATAQAVLFSARQGDADNLWQIPISAQTGTAQGPPRQLTFGTSEREPSVADDGRMVFASGTTNQDVWSVPLDANRGTVVGEPIQLTRDTARDAAPSISADGTRLVFSSDRSGSRGIWLKDMESNESIELVTRGNRGLVSRGRDQSCLSERRINLRDLDEKWASPEALRRLWARKRLGLVMGWSEDPFLVGPPDQNRHAGCDVRTTD